MQVLVLVKRPDTQQALDFSLLHNSGGGIVVRNDQRTGHIMNSFLAIGECMVEVAPSGDDKFTMSFAGDTFNTAWYMRRTLPDQHRVGYGTVAGTDGTSQAMIRFMQDAGLDISTIHRDPSRTVGLYLIQLTDGERNFSYWRGQSAARQLASDPQRLKSDIANFDMLFFSGITLAILPEADRQVFLDTLNDAKQTGARIVFDTNLRPGLWADTGTMCQWTERAAAIADIVLPSFDDEALFFGDATPAATAQRYRKHSDIVVVKNASDPVYVSVGDTLSTISVDPVGQIVDSTAAGDSFDAGFLAALMQGDTLEVSVQKGADLAAKVVQGRGALVPV